jgi:hypothetical protein
VLKKPSQVDEIRNHLEIERTPARRGVHLESCADRTATRPPQYFQRQSLSAHVRGSRNMDLASRSAFLFKALRLKTFLLPGDTGASAAPKSMMKRRKTICLTVDQPVETTPVRCGDEMRMKSCYVKLTRTPVPAPSPISASPHNLRKRRCEPGFYCKIQGTPR